MEILKKIRNKLLMLSVVPEIIYHVCRYEIDKNYKWGNEMFSKYAKWVIREIDDENGRRNKRRITLSNKAGLFRLFTKCYNKS